MEFYDPLPAALSGIPDEVAGFADAAANPTPMGVAQPRAKDGILDVTRPPFSADPAGMLTALTASNMPGRVCKMALLHSLHSSRKLHHLAIHHRNSDPPHALHRAFARPSKERLLWRVPPRWSFFALRTAPCARCTGRHFVCPTGTSFFSNASRPAPVLSFQMVNAIGKFEPNAQYGSVVVGLTVVIGAHNPGAIGIRLRGAQGSGLEDVTVIFEGGKAPDAWLVWRVLLVVVAAGSTSWCSCHRWALRPRLSALSASKYTELRNITRSVVQRRGLLWI